MLKSFVTLVLLALATAHAIAAPLDRSAEVEQLLLAIESGTRNTLIETARDIHNADVADARLAQALLQKLKGDLPTLDPRNAIDNKYRKSMVVAIASTGMPDVAPDLRNMCAGLRTNVNSTYCDDAAERVDWYRLRNVTAGSERYCREGANRRDCAIMNLIMADDFSLKREGVQRMNWGKSLDPAFVEVLEPQVLAYLEAHRNTKVKLPLVELDTIANYVKILGYSGNPKYRDTLLKARDFRPSVSVQRRANEALRRLTK